MGGVQHTFWSFKAKLGAGPHLQVLSLSFGILAGSSQEKSWEWLGHPRKAGARVGHSVEAGSLGVGEAARGCRVGEVWKVSRAPPPGHILESWNPAWVGPSQPLIASGLGSLSPESHLLRCRLAPARTWPRKENDYLKIKEEEVIHM